MIAVVQRVKSSSVKVNNTQIASINKGVNILLGVIKEDNINDVKKLAKKIAHLRIFPNSDGKFDKSLIDIKAEALVISQFTLGANVKKGNRPDFFNAMNPKEAKELYLEFIKELSNYVEVKSGEFGANMEVEIINDGPVTIIIDSKKL